MKIVKNVKKWPFVTRATFMEANGCGCVIVEKPLNKQAWLYNLNVTPRERHRGIATALMDAAEQWCMEQGYDSVGLEWSANESEQWTAQWYARRGWQECGCNADGTNFLMQKKLNPETTK